MEQKQRQGQIIRTIANHPGITLADLCLRLKSDGVEVTERTIAKDILALKNEFGLLPDKPRLRNGYFLKGVCSLSEQDLELVLDALHIFAGRLNDQDALELVNRLLNQEIESGKRMKKTMRTVRQREIYSKTTGKGKQVQEQIRATIKQAIRSRQAVCANYFTPRIGKTEERKGYPLLMVFHERGWYCITKDLKGNDYRPNRVDRFRSCSIIKSQPQNESHTDDLLQAEFLMGCGWGMMFPRNLAELKAAESKEPIVIRFDRTVAPFILESVERHPKGTVSPLKDGTGDAQFKVQLADAREFLHWVRSFGSHAWVVSPPSLRQSERAELRRMQQRYSD